MLHFAIIAIIANCSSSMILSLLIKVIKLAKKKGREKFLDSVKIKAGI